MPVLISASRAVRRAADNPCDSGVAGFHPDVGQMVVGCCAPAATVNPAASNKSTVVRSARATYDPGRAALSRSLVMPHFPSAQRFEELLVPLSRRLQPGGDAIAILDIRRRPMFHQP